MKTPAPAGAPAPGNALQRSRHFDLPPNLPPRGLRREAAADYIGISPSKFDELVKDGRMPAAVRIDGRCIWDRIALDRAFDKLGGIGDANEWDGL